MLQSLITSALLILQSLTMPSGPTLQEPTLLASGQIDLLRDVVYGTGGGRPLRLHLVRPSNPPEDPMPVVVWIHGGAWRRGSPESGLKRLSALAKRGYVGAAIEYRLSGEATFPAQIEDCKAAIRFLRAESKRYGIDPNRIGVWGASAGGHLVALLGTSGDVPELEGSGGHPDQSSRVQAVCDFYGPTDFLRMNDHPGTIDHDAANSPESELMGGPIQRGPDEVALANPITYVSEDDPPFLIVHGDQDQLVPINQSERLHEALLAAGVSSRFERVVGGGHGSRFPPKIQTLVDDFFDQTLFKEKDQEPIDKDLQPCP